MAYNIAVASTDGKVVNEHFGHAQRYLIFTVDEEAQSFSFSEFRPVVAPCEDQTHSIEGFERVASDLADCDVVLISRIGNAARKYLTGRNMFVLEYGRLIPEALEKIIEYYKPAMQR